MTESPLVARWTSSIKIPKTNKDAKIKARAVEWRGNILMVEEISHGASGPRDIKLSVFDTETHELFDIPSQIPQFDNERMNRIAISNDSLYIWFRRNQDGKLYKYDLNQQEWSQLMLIENHPFSDNIVIVGNIMYVSSINDETNRHRVIMINLETKERVDTAEDHNFHLRSSELGRGFVVHDGILYMTYFVDHDRHIEKFVDGQWQLVEVDDARPNDLVEDDTLPTSTGFRTINLLTNGRMLLEKCVSSRATFLDTFNFETLKWERAELETGWYDAYNDIIHSTIEIHDVIYLLIKGSPFSDQYEIRMLDMGSQPKLSDICLRDLVDTVEGSWEIEAIQRIRQKLCIPSRKRFDNLTSWRIADFAAKRPNGKKLNNEYEKMRNEEVIQQEMIETDREGISDNESSELSEASDSELSELSNFSDID